MSEVGRSETIGHCRLGAAIPPATQAFPAMPSRASTALRIPAVA